VNKRQTGNLVPVQPAGATEEPLREPKASSKREVGVTEDHYVSSASEPLVAVGPYPQGNGDRLLTAPEGKTDSGQSGHLRKASGSLSEPEGVSTSTRPRHRGES